MVKLLKNKIAELLYKPERSTTIISETDAGLLALAEALLALKPELSAYRSFINAYKEYRVSVNGVTREQLLKLVVQQPEQLITKPSEEKEKRRLEII